MNARYIPIKRQDGWHIRDTVTGNVSGIIPGGEVEARRGADNLWQARVDSARITARKRGL